MVRLDLLVTSSSSSANALDANDFATHSLREASPKTFVLLRNSITNEKQIHNKTRTK